MEKRTWQIQGLEEFFRTNNHLFECCTGSGKTFFAISAIKKILEENPESRVLIVSPLNIIVENWYKELQEHNFDMWDIGLYYAGMRSESKITLTNVDNVLNMNYKEYDVLIFDEVHHAGTPRMLEFLKHDFKFRMGLSATIDRIDGADWEIREIFDYNLFEYGIKEAIEDGVINTFNFHVIGVDVDSVTMKIYKEIEEKIRSIRNSNGSHTNIMSYAPIEVKQQYLGLMTERKKLINNYPKKFDFLINLCKKHLGEETLVFNEYNDVSDYLYFTLLKEGITSEVIHSGRTDLERENVLKSFGEKKFNFLIATRVIDEGWNVPSCQNGIILANSSNKKQMIQRMGRVLRKKDEPSNIYYVYCKETVEEDYMNEHFDRFSDLAENVTRT